MDISESAYLSAIDNWGRVPPMQKHNNKRKPIWGEDIPPFVTLWASASQWLKLCWLVNTVRSQWCFRNKVLKEEYAVCWLSIDVASLSIISTHFYIPSLWNNALLCSFEMGSHSKTANYVSKHSDVWFCLQAQVIGHIDILSYSSFHQCIW